MSHDAGLALFWLGVFTAGIAVCALLSRAGLAGTHVRDLLHIGAGVWVLGWPAWTGATWPIAITLGAVIGLALVPVFATHVEWLRKARAVVASGGDRWSGLLAYAFSFAVFTALGLTRSPFPAAAALAALALGDGVGGLIGQRFGRHRFRVPGAKEKSLEGSLGVAVASALGIAGASGWFHAPLSGQQLCIAAAAAAVAEAFSPRASDNLTVPAVVWGALTAMQAM